MHSDEREEAEERATRESEASPQEEPDDSHLRAAEPEARESPATVMSDEPPVIVEPEPEEEDEPAETKELGEVNVKSAVEESRVKKCIVSYQSKVLKSREPSPAPSHGKRNCQNFLFF